MHHSEVCFTTAGEVRKTIPSTFPIPRDYVIPHEVEVTTAMDKDGLAPKVLGSDAESITLAYGGVSIASLFDSDQLFMKLDGRPEAACAIIVGYCRLLEQASSKGAFIVDANLANFVLALADMIRRSGRLMLQSILSIDHFCTMHPDVLLNKPLLLAVNEKHNPVLAPETRKMIAQAQAEAASQLCFRNWRELCRALKQEPTFLHSRWAELDVYYNKVPREIDRAMQYSLGITARQMGTMVDLSAIAHVIDRMCMTYPDERFDSFDDIIAAILAVFPELPVESLNEMAPIIELTRPQARSSVLFPSDSELIIDEKEPVPPMPHPSAPEEEVIEPEEVEFTPNLPAPASASTTTTSTRPWGRKLAAFMAGGIIMLCGFGLVGRHLAAPEGVLLRTQLLLARDAFGVLAAPHPSHRERTEALATVAGIAASNSYVNLRVDAFVKRHALHAPELIAKAKSKPGKAELNAMLADLKILHKSGHAEAGLLVVAIEAAASGNAKRIRQAMDNIRNQPAAALAMAILEQAQHKKIKPS